MVKGARQTRRRDGFIEGSEAGFGEGLADLPNLDRLSLRRKPFHIVYLPATTPATSEILLDANKRLPFALSRRQRIR